MRCALATVLLTCATTTIVAQQGSTSPVEREAAYAASIARIADSAIHHLEFFPVRAQLRAQMLLITPGDTSIAVFAELARRSTAAAQVVDDISARFERIDVPDDLHRLNADLVASLRGARASLDRLAATANACQFDPTSVARCQTPFSSASSALTAAYRRYLDVRDRIAAQITDTDTRLPRFAAGRAP